MAGRPLRVLQLGSPNGMYGAERWILALIRYLDRARVHTVVGVIVDEPGLDPPLLKHAEALGVSTMSIDALGRMNLSAVVKLRNFICANEIDVLHTHFYKTDAIGLLAVRGTKCKIVSTPHGWSTEAGFALRVYEALDRHLFRYFDAVAPLSPELFTELDGRPIRNLRLILNGVDVDEIDATAKTARSYAWQSGGGLIVGYIGQLIARKGVDTLLNAFARLADTRAELVIVGEGDQRGALQALATSLGVHARTHFLGYRDDRLELLRSFSVLALPSKLEGIPRCVMEAMVARVPVVASDIPGPRELISHLETGLLFEPGNVDALAEALNSLTGVWVQSLKDKARRFVVERYSAAAMSASYVELYGLLHHPGPAAAATQMQIDPRP